MTYFLNNLTVDNIEATAHDILDFLTGHKYSFVSAYEYKRFEPETKLHQSLENGTNGSPLSSWIGEDGKYGGFNFCDTYGVWGVTTGDKATILFERDSITIHKTNGDGRTCYWQLTLED